MQILSNFRRLLRILDGKTYIISEVNAAYTEFLAKFTECYNAAFLAVEVKHNFRKSRKPWVDKALYERIPTKNKLYHDFVHNRDATLFKEFKNFRNKIKTPKVQKQLTIQNGSSEFIMTVRKFGAR